jgi:hypothetical protein
MEAALFVVFYGLILFGWSTFGSFEARLERGGSDRCAVVCLGPPEGVKFR